MKNEIEILHYGEGDTHYDVVTLIADTVCPHNSLRVIRKDGEELWTGGHVFDDTPENRKFLDLFIKEFGTKTYDKLTWFRNRPITGVQYDETY